MGSIPLAMLLNLLILAAVISVDQVIGYVFIRRDRRDRTLWWRFWVARGFAYIGALLWMLDMISLPYFLALTAGGIIAAAVWPSS